MSYIISTAIIALVIGVLGHVDALIVLGYILIGVQVISRTWTKYVLSRTVISRNAADHAFPGDRISVTLTVHNTSRLPLPWLYLRDAWPQFLMPEPIPAWAITLQAHERQTFRYNILCRKRGLYSLGPLEAKAGAVLEDSSSQSNSNVMGIERQWSSRNAVTVYPAIVPLERLGLPSLLALGNIRTRRHFIEDPSRIAGVRDYQPGDDPRFIDWRTSARLDSLSVKQFERSQPLPLAIFLDLRAGSYTRSNIARASEVGIIAAGSLCAQVIALHQQAGLCTNGTDPLKGKSSEFGSDVEVALRAGDSSLIAILDILARIQVNHESTSEPLPAVMRRWSMGLPWGTTVALITPTLTPDVISGITQLRKTGFAAVCIFTDEPASFTKQPSYATQVKALGFPAYDVAFVEDVYGVQTA